MQWKFLTIILAAAFFLCAGCNDSSTQSKEEIKTKVASAVSNSCRSCHKDVQLDNNHNFACSRCHGGNSQSMVREEAHQELVRYPSHPQFMMQRCGSCHEEQVKNCSDSLHFTLHNAVNLTKTHFGAKDLVHDLTRIPISSQEQVPLNLADDMLRRRCLRCHVYNPGDSYPLVTRGTGCAACHRVFKDGKQLSHRFRAQPKDEQCLTCHYGNYVGNDYYGRYEHDYNWEYRTPYVTSEEFIRPYGVELHDLAPDAHQQKGLVCIDCHTGASLKNNSNTLQCQTCHAWQQNEIPPAHPNILVEKGQLILYGAFDNKPHPIPPMVNPAHTQYPQVACQVCHAQWAFNDSPTYLLRSESDDPDPWERLTVQSSSWVEYFLENNLYGDDDEIDPVMADGITGVVKEGVWLKGYGQRRWEDIIIQKDTDGVIKVFRPILDLQLSAVNEDEEVLWDNVKGNGSGLLPYTPHTTGKAGLFYTNRFFHLLNQ